MSFKPTDAAYPMVNTEEFLPQYGQDIRTDIAKHVLQGLVANPDTMRGDSAPAESAVRLADDLIRVLNSTPMPATRGPKVGAKVKRNANTLIHANAISCKFVHEFYAENQRFWVLAVKFSDFSPTNLVPINLVVELAENCEVVQE